MTRRLNTYHERESRVRPKQIASLQPRQTPEAVITVRSSTSVRICSKSSIGISFQSVITLPSIFTWPPPIIISFSNNRFKSSVLRFSFPTISQTHTPQPTAFTNQQRSPCFCHQKYRETNNG